jgi:hypothetical protein
LEAHGPLEPLGYYRARLHQVRGTSAPAVRAQLRRLLGLYNRAAADFGVPQSRLTERDLVYPFLLAVPEAVRSRLMEGLKLALQQVDPLEVLYRAALPLMPTDPPAVPSPPAPVAAVGAGDAPSPALVAALRAVLKGEKKRTPRGARAAPPPPRAPFPGPLPTAGRAPAPAGPGACFRCGALDHQIRNCPHPPPTRRDFRQGRGPRAWS